MNIVDIAREYFTKFSNKDLAALEDMFADDVALVDWQINKSGKKNVLKANKGIFTSVNKLSVEVHTLVSSVDTVFAEITVRADDTAALSVVDIIVFDSTGKIKKITAYKR